MESSGKKKGLMGRLLLVVLLAATGGAAFVQYHCPLLKLLAQKQDHTFYIAVLTQPAMLVSYNPATRKSVWATVKRKKTPTQPLENAQDLYKQAAVQQSTVLYYIPINHKREAVWEQFKADLSTWRHHPWTIGRLAWQYFQAYHDKRTNLSVGTFLLLAMDASRLEITDFTIKQTEETKASRSSAAASLADIISSVIEDRAPLAIEDRPLLLEVLNASGHKGAAKDLTHYLRELNQQGLLSVDVLQYDTFHGPRQNNTHIVDYTGRRNALKQLSGMIGLNSEIVSEKQDTAIYDARIIIGEDFKLPLR